MCASIGFIEQSLIEDEADILSEDIIKCFGKYNVSLGIPRWWHKNSRFIFKTKLKGNTREPHVRAHTQDVRDRLKLPMFYVEKNDFTLYIVASRAKIEYDHLPVLLQKSEYQQVLRRAQLPYIVGYNAWGNIVMDDLAQFPHLLLGGSTNSGKSVGLQALITTIAYSKSPSKVNFILIDVGATDLMPFESLPHLSCPVVRERTVAIQTLAALVLEMERRIELEYADPASFKQLPRLVLVIDEFPALFVGIDKDESKLLTNSVSSLLQRGRHANIHLVLAAQNPTFQNMKIDLGNIAARIAFKCAKRNFSETILGEGGGESLIGHGDLLLRSPRYDSLLRIQGIYISPTELQEATQQIAAKSIRMTTSNKFSLVCPNDDAAVPTGDLASQLSCSVVRQWPLNADQLLASVIVWALARSYISINMLMNEYRIGWNKASKLVNRLEELGIVDRPEGKLPRKIIPSFPEDLPEELMTFLKKSGYSENSIISACYSRDCD